MIQGMYSAATAVDALGQSQDVVAQNIANATTPGYRRQAVVFETLGNGQSQESTPSPSSVGTRVAKVFTEFTPGDYQYTGNSLDLAVRGDGFFVLDGPKGPLYTRNGVFELNGKGELQAKGGLPVEAVSGRITIPPETSQISISADGTVIANNTAVGQLRLARFDDPRQLVVAGTTLFKAPTGVEAQNGGGTVLQGYREGSNVQVVNEMAQMIAGMRQYEAAQRAMRALSDAAQQNSRP